MIGSGWHSAATIACSGQQRSTNAGDTDEMFGFECPLPTPGIGDEPSAVFGDTEVDAGRIRGEGLRGLCP